VYSEVLLFARQIAEEEVMQHVLVITSDENLINFLVQEKFSPQIRIAHYEDVFKGLRTLTFKKYDILVFDIDAPSMDAVHAVDVARNLMPDLHIIVIAHDDSFLHNTKLSRQNIGHLMFKPIQFDQLRNHIRFLSQNKITADFKHNRASS
jgi:DNA-binding NtrC family response regulator